MTVEGRGEWAMALGQAAMAVEKEDDQAICGMFCNCKSLWLDFNLAKAAKLLLTFLPFCLSVRSLPCRRGKFGAWQNMKEAAS